MAQEINNQNNQNIDPYYETARIHAIVNLEKYYVVIIEAVIYTESKKIKRITFKRVLNPDNTFHYVYIPKERFIILEILSGNKPTNLYDIYLTPIEIYFKSTKSILYDLIQIDNYREVNKTIVLMTN